MFGNISNITGNGSVMMDPAHHVSEGGVFSGKSVLHSWLAQFLVQAVIVMALSRIFDFFLRFLRQPRVIAEVLSGICLGPSVLGRIPGFSDTIFPSTSIEPLKLVANIGLVLYMFLVGLELDPRSFFANIRSTMAISFAGIVVPFAFGVAVSWGVYNSLLSAKEMHTTPFASFLLFTGVAMSITAFPVLARIMSERRLFGTTVGSMTISSAAFNDAVAWCLLALVLSIINAGDQLTALWVFLTMTAYILILLVPVRFIFAKGVRYTMKSRRFATSTIGQPFLALTFMFIFISAWITEFLGVHAIFGAFLVGVIMPRGTGIVVSLTEKIEDLVSVVLLPLYFASSGLKTQIGLLNDGITWGWLVAVVVVAVTGKILGCMLAAKASRLTWRESLSVGVLMNTKGLVELIVLNIGLDAGVINERIFAVMIVMCLVTTFMTSPLIAYIYPPHHQKSVADAMEAAKAKKRARRQEGEDDWLHNKLNLLTCVDSMEQVPSIINLVSKIQTERALNEALEVKTSKFTFNVLRFMEISERSSTLFYAASAQDISPAQNDPLLQTMTLFTRLMNIPTKYFYAVSHTDGYTDEIEALSNVENFNILLLPVNPDGGDQMVEAVLKNYRNIGPTPVLYVDKKRGTESTVTAQLTTTASRANLVSVVDNGHTNQTMESQLTNGSGSDNYTLRVLVPFVGGPVDRKALRIALRLSINTGVQVIILQIEVVDKDSDTPPSADQSNRNSKGPISYISSKLQDAGKQGPIDHDELALNDAKKYASDRPGIVEVKSVITNNLFDCVVAECRQGSCDLVVLSHASTGVMLTEKDRERIFKRASSSGKVDTLQGSLGRKFSASNTLRDSFRKRSGHPLLPWPSAKETLLGSLGHRLLNDTQSSLLVVGQQAIEDTEQDNC